MNHNQYHGQPSRQHWHNQGQCGHVPFQQQRQHVSPAWQVQEQETYMPYRQQRISIVEAMDIALKQVPGQVVKAELDHEKGMLVYEIDIVTAQNVKYEVVVDANNGSVIEVKLD